MAISVVQRNKGDDVAGVTGHVAVAFGSNNTAGNTIIVILVGSDTTLALWNSDYPLVSDSKVNTYTNVFNQFNVANGVGIRAYVANAIAAGANTVTQQDNNDACGLYIYEVSGLATSSPFDRSQFAVIGSSTAFTSGNTPTTTVANELLIGFAIATAAPTWTVGSGYSNLQTNGAVANAGAAQEQIVSSTGAYSSTLTSSLSSSGLAAIVTFKGATSGAATSTPHLLASMGVGS
jgi:hypothetical protein